LQTWTATENWDAKFITLWEQHYVASNFVSDFVKWFYIIFTYEVDVFLSLQNSGKNLVVKIHTTLSQKYFNAQLGSMTKLPKFLFSLIFWKYIRLMKLLIRWWIAQTMSRITHNNVINFLTISTLQESNTSSHSSCKIP
jgi:hypothetical protein